jgi:hypothetical protein
MGGWARASTRLSHTFNHDHHRVGPRHVLMMVTHPFRTPVPSSAELACRYVLGLRHPDLAYLEAVEAYLDRIYGPSIGARVSCLLEWLDPDHPLGANSGVETATETTWCLTRLGIGTVFSLLTDGPYPLPYRQRFSRRVLVTMALLGAMDPCPLADSLHSFLTDLVPPELLPLTPPGNRVSADQIRANTWMVDAALAFERRLLLRMIMADEGHSALRSVAHLENRGIVRSVRTQRVVRVAGIVTRTHVKRLRSMARSGEAALTPLARALLFRRIDRSPITPQPDSPLMSDAAVGRAILAAHLATSSEVGAIAEQVVLRHPEQIFNPLRPPRSHHSKTPRESTTMATRRVDLVLWALDNPEKHPSTLIEIERAKSASDTYLRVRHHLEGAMAVSALGHRPVELVFVADSTSRPRIVATVAAFRNQFRSAAAGLWEDAHVTVRVVPLGQARLSGLVSSTGADASEWSATFSGRGSKEGEPVVPLAMLA